MAGQQVGEIYYEVSADVADLIQGAKQAQKAIDSLESTAKQSSKGFDTLEKGASSAGDAMSTLNGYSRSIDGSLNTLNTTVKAIARAMLEARSSTGSASSEFSRAESVIEALGNQLAILEEANENGARSAAVLASQLRAGSTASDEEKNTVGQLAAAFFDLKASTDESAKSAASANAAFQKAESSISKLEGDVSILSTEMQSGTRSAAIFAAQLSAGVGATQEQKNKIADLTGSLYDMREAQSAAARSASEAAKKIAQEAREANNIASVISGLSQQLSVLSEQQNSGARSAAILAAQMRAGDAATQNQKAKIAELVGSLYDLKEAQSASAREANESAKQLAMESRETDKTTTITNGLSQQISILSEQQANGARSAAILAAQLRAGSNATDEEKKKIADLTGQLFDMKTGTEAGAKSSGQWKNKMQQAGYQVQDFIVQIQGGQSALIAFSQQGSQLAGAFGPGGAILGAVLALGSVLAGTLITSLNGGKNAMDSLADAAEAMDKVITISQNGVAALSNKYANLARVNGEVATLMRNQALLEYNQAIAKIPKAISDASASFISFGDKIVSSLGGGYASVKVFGDGLEALNITTNNYTDAIRQAYGAGQAFSATANSIGNTVGVLADKFGISQQQAFELAKQLSEINRNPSPEAIQALALRLQNMTSSSKDGQAQITTLVGTLVDLAREASTAAYNVDLLKKTTDNLTDGQKNLIKQSERNLTLSKLQGEARARLQAQYNAEDAGLSKDDPHTKQMEEDAAATYKNTEAQRTLKSETKKGVTQAESAAQKLADLKQQSELAADSTQELTREQQLLRAEQSLGAGATDKQKQKAREYKAAALDAADAAKGVTEALKSIPEEAENKSYADSMKNLKAALKANSITKSEYDKASEAAEREHQVNLAKIRSEAASGVTPLQDAQGAIDPVQALANENARKLALIQQFETEKGVITANGLALMNAQNTEYEQARIDAAWKIWENQNQTSQLLGGAIDSLQGGATNAITGLINGTQSLQESLANIGTTILNSVVGGLVEMGLQYVKSMVMGQVAAAASLAATTAQASAAALAWAPAAMSASIATYGTAATVGSTAYAGALAMAQGMAVAGARKNGGPVSAGSMYQVGEGGMPEIYQASTGKQYMIPGDNGSVISNKDMQSSGSNGGTISQVNHFNFDGATADTAQTQAAYAKIAYEQSLRAIKEQQRPGGMLQKSR